jgi:integrase
MSEGRSRILLNGAGLPSMRIHDLRHTCGTLLLAQGVDPKAVQSIWAIRRSA